MRKDTNKDLDLLFKEGLEDARVKAPRGVWKAVSARLDSAAPAAAAAAQKRSWLVWGAPAFAFAAAAIAAVLYVGTTEKTIIHSGESIISVTEQQSGPLAEAAVPASEAQPVRAASSVGVRASFVPKEIQTPEQITEVLPEPVAQPESSSATTDSDQVSGEGTANVDSAVGGDTKAKEVSEDNQAFWAGIEAEDEAQARKSAAKKSHKAAIKAGGLVGVNDSHFNNGPTGPSFSSGYSSGAVTETSVSRYVVPMSFGLSARYHFTDKIALSAGVNWSFLSRDFDGKYKTAEGRFTHNMQYIGIPISVAYEAIDSKTLSFYCYAGGSAEKAISSNYFIYADSAAPIYTEKVPSLQYGIFGGIGVEFKLSNLLGIYVDPCVKYYFPGDQPKSIRTDKPLSFSFEAGLRFNL